MVGMKRKGPAPPPSAARLAHKCAFASMTGSVSLLFVGDPVTFEMMWIHNEVKQLQYSGTGRPLLL